MFSNFKKRRELGDYLDQEKYSFTEIFENSPDILLFVMDAKGMIVNVRGAILQLVGMEAKDIIGKKYQRFIYKEDIQKVEAYITNVLNGQTQYAKYRITDGKDLIVPIDVTLTPIQLTNDEVIGFYGLTQNISNEIQLQQMNLELRETTQSIIHNVHEVISIVDAECVITFQSPSIKSILGYHVEEMLGQTWFNFIHQDDLQMAKKKFNEMLTQPNTLFTIEFRLKHKNGEWRNFRVIHTNLLDNPNVNGIIGNFSDITEIKNKELEIQYMAYHDYLTTLPNRRAFNDRLDLELRLANVDKREFAILIFNLDRFKFLNDTYGHHIGDLLLIDISRKVESVLHKDIEMIARISGDEFAILTKNIQSSNQIERIAKTILNVFEQPFNVEVYELFLTASIGISIYPEFGEDAGSLMQNAGLALYHAKKAAHHTYHIYSPTATIETYKLFTLQNGLRNAFHSNQFLVYYQPIIHGETNEIVAAEALIRWNHPDWGIVSPNEFIPLAEESGLIIKLGEWVLKSVCKKLRSWHDAGYMIKGSVNLSLIQFLQENLIDVITSTLLEYKLEPEWLTIEITETTMLEQKEIVLEKLNQIRALGIKIALDDFGDGFASFKNLKDVKPDFLKIDRSLIKDIPSDQDSIEMVTSIIQLAHRLSISVVAEGIETKEQKEFLSELECERMQGYLFSKPVPEEIFEKILKNTVALEMNQLLARERRAYFRIELPYPLEGLMTISELSGKRVQLGNTKILIEDIGPGGLRFLSKIKLPANSNILLKFQVIMADENRTYFGEIVHESELDDLNRYGVKFIVNEHDRERLIELFHRLQVQLRKNPLLEGYPFMTEDVVNYFKQL